MPAAGIELEILVVLVVVAEGHGDDVDQVLGLEFLIASFCRSQSLFSVSSRSASFTTPSA